MIIESDMRNIEILLLKETCNGYAITGECLIIMLLLIIIMFINYYYVY